MVSSLVPPPSGIGPGGVSLVPCVAEFKLTHLSMGVASTCPLEMSYNLEMCFCCFSCLVIGVLFRLVEGEGKVRYIGVEDGECIACSWITLRTTASIFLFFGVDRYFLIGMSVGTAPGSDSFLLSLEVETHDARIPDDLCLVLLGFFDPFLE